MKEYLRKWERVNEGTDRLKVPGGWLVSIEASCPPSPGGAALSVALCFVPDPSYTWELEDEK